MTFLKGDLDAPSSGAPRSRVRLHGVRYQAHPVRDPMATIGAITVSKAQVKSGYLRR